jgi:hypothetical protein
MTRNRSHTDAEDSIASSLDRLREELTVVRQVLDDIREELEWANRNRSEPTPSPLLPRRITSMPLDPCAADWAERLNRYSAADIVDETAEPSAKQQGELF